MLWSDCFSLCSLPYKVQQCDSLCEASISRLIISIFFFKLKGLIYVLCPIIFLIIILIWKKKCEANKKIEMKKKNSMYLFLYISLNLFYLIK